jgi:alkylation response protein AidB-like acyl-CoA dehydrogenase
MGMSLTNPVYDQYNIKIICLQDSRFDLAFERDKMNLVLETLTCARLPMPDFSLNDEQRALEELARDFAQKQIAPVAQELDRTGKFPFEILAQAHRLGLMNLTRDAAYGGGGLGWIESAIVSEEFGAARGVTTAVNANELALTPLQIAASDEQKKKFMTPIAQDGGLAAFCVTEPGAGSDVVSMRTRAVKKGDEYVLNGTKHFISNGSVAQMLTVFAFSDPEQKHRGISAFVVPADLPGITRRHMGDKMGHRASDTSEIALRTFMRQRVIDSATKVTASRLPWKHSTSLELVSALPESELPGRHWMRRSNLQKSGSSSVNRSRTMKGYSSCSQIWR